MFSTPTQPQSGGIYKKCWADRLPDSLIRMSEGLRCLSLSDDETSKKILKSYRNIAIVGLSRDPAKDSNSVARYMIGKGYRITPINPNAREILGLACYPRLLDLPEPIQQEIEVVAIFRPSQDVHAIVSEAVILKSQKGKPNAIWMQLDIVDKKSARRASEAGLQVVMDRCLRIEHQRLEVQEDHQAPD